MDEQELEFVLDPKLASDCFLLSDLPLSHLLLMNDSQYPWFILVPRRAGVKEIYHLDEADQQQLLREASALAAAVSDIFAAKKMNIANLGNLVSQFHLHVIARKTTDPAWPGPVWGSHAPVPYTEAELAGLKQRLDRILEDGLAFEPS